MMPGVERLYDVIDRTWPAARRWCRGPWTLRDGQRGGKRVSAATARHAVAADDVALAEREMAEIGQTPFFMIRAEDDALDRLLADQGYDVADPVTVHVAPVARLAVPTPRLSTFTVWEPLAVQRDIWAAGGIGPERVAVMARVKGPRTSLFARCDDHPAGTGFCAIDGDIAMVHALEVAVPFRRRRVGRLLMQQAALWAQSNAATTYISAVCTRENEGANALYASLGMTRVGHYHYRQKAQE